jgi:uncharacterized protein involved in outer membrane biogenesis
MRLRTKRIAWVLAALVGVLALVVVLLPRLIDAEAYRPAIIEAVRDATGRELVIDGPVRLRLFPVPGIGAGQVRFANAIGAKGAQMVDVRWVSVRPDWLALLQGRVQVGVLTLYRPTIILEADADGVPNWEFSPGAGSKQKPDEPAAGFHMAIGRLSIVHGTVNFTDPVTKRRLLAEDMTASATVGSFDGPIILDGSATVNGVPLTLAFSFDAPTGKGHATKLSLEVSSGKLFFDGQLSSLRPDADVNGHLRVETGTVTDFISSVIGAIGQEKPVFERVVAGKFSFDGDISVGSDHVVLKDFHMSMGRDSAAGSLALTYKPAPSVEGRLSLNQLDLDKWLDLLAKPGLLALPAAPASPAAPAAPAKPAPANPAPAKPAPAADKPAPAPQINASLSIDIGEMTWRKEAIREVSIAVEMAKNVMSVPRLRMVLPGAMTVQGSGMPEGTFDVSGAKLRETLAWLGVDASAIPKERLQRLTANGKLKSAAGGLQLSDIAFEIDDLKGKAGGTVTLGLPIGAAFQLELDRLDLDAYLPPPAATIAPLSPAAPASDAAAANPSANLGLKAKVAKLVYRGETLNGVDGDVAVQGNLLKLNNLAIADLLGAKLALKGTVTDFAKAPRFDVTFNASAPDTDRVLHYLRLPTFLNGKIGAASAAGVVAGTMKALTVRDVAVNFLGVSGRASGTLSLGDAFAFELSSFALQTSDLSRLASVASGKPMNGLGSLSAAGSLKGASQKAVFTGELTARGTPMNGTIDASLGERPKVSANLKVPGVLDLDQWLGVSAAPAPAASTLAARPGAVTATPIDLSAMRSFDASLTVFTSAMTVASLRINYCDFQATLNNGRLTLAKLTGQIYGGGVDFSGTVDATGSALAVDIKGDVRGIYIGEMLRGTAGTNNFGNEDLTVAIEGKIDATGIRISGKGRSPQEIRDGLSGGAAVGGTVYANVVKGSQSFAQFATGVASIFSEAMAFNNFVLGAFINRQNNLSGQIQLNGATVTTQNQTLQGQNATASINSRTDIARATTDTTIQLAGGGDRFVATVKGPLSAPKLSTTRAR